MRLQPLLGDEKYPAVCSGDYVDCFASAYRLVRAGAKDHRTRRRGDVFRLALGLDTLETEPSERLLGERDAEERAPIAHVVDALATRVSAEHRERLAAVEAVRIARIVLDIDRLLDALRAARRHRRRRRNRTDHETSCSGRCKREREANDDRRSAYDDSNRAEHHVADRRTRRDRRHSCQRRLGALQTIRISIETSRKTGINCAPLLPFGCCRAIHRISRRAPVR